MSTSEGEILINDTNLYEIKTYFVSLLRPIFLIQAKVISRTVKRNTRHILSVRRTSIKFSYARRYIFTYHVHIDATREGSGTVYDSVYKNICSTAVCLLHYQQSAPSTPICRNMLYLNDQKQGNVNVNFSDIYNEHQAL